LITDDVEIVPPGSLGGRAVRFSNCFAPLWRGFQVAVSHGFALSTVSTLLGIVSKLLGIVSEVPGFVWKLSGAVWWVLRFVSKRPRDAWKALGIVSKLSGGVR
jgi:hypothetical protein